MSASISFYGQFIIPAGSLIVTSALPVRMIHYNCHCLPSHQPSQTRFPSAGFSVPSCPTAQCWSPDWFPIFYPVRSWSICSIPVPVLVNYFVFCLTLVWSLSDSHPHWFLRQAFLWYWKLPLKLNSGLWSFEIYFHYLLPFILINKLCLIKFCINFRSAFCGYADVYDPHLIQLTSWLSLEVFDLSRLPFTCGTPRYL